MKVKTTKNVGGDSMRPRLSEIFDSIKELSTDNSCYHETHPEADFLWNYSWRGMITIRFESDLYSQGNGPGESRRMNFIRLLMDNLRKKWKLRKKQLYWVASTEFGKSGDAHCHIIFNFHALEIKGKIPPDLSNMEEELEESCRYITMNILEIFDTFIDLNWKPSFNDFGLVSYVCKKESGREYKDFIWSTGGDKWIAAVTKYVVHGAFKKEAA